jgi:uroporphyrinogen-III decarboxylase
MNKQFRPDYRNVLDVLYNRKPKRLPLYEHHIDTVFISKCLQKELVIQGNKLEDYKNYYQKIIGFWKDMTYDAFDYEAAICDVFPGHGAIFGGKLGPIQTRKDFEKYPFEEIPKLFWEKYVPHLEAIRKVLPDGMKAYGGCGYGIFESSQDLVGYENLCIMQYSDPELFAELFNKIGNLYEELWSEMVKRYNDIFVFFRMGDDLGYKSSTLLAPEIIRTCILPQYQRIIEIIHRRGKRFLLHSCGNIFNIMDDLINLQIDAKHSNEDEIAPFERWLELYSDKIGFFGGIDVNVLALKNYDEIYNIVFENGVRFRSMAKGYGIGSGNSIPEYIPEESFKAMINAVNEIRRIEKTN